VSVEKVSTLRLDLPHERTCDCPENHLSCIDAKTWLKRQIGVWEFFYDGRDVRDKKVHPATFPVSLAEQVIELFTHEGELVLDPFVGSGTTVLAAWEKFRNSVGFDLNADYIDFAKKRLNDHVAQNRQIEIDPDTAEIDRRPRPVWAFVCDDAVNIPEYLDDETVACIFTSPPYANLLNRKRKNKSRRGGDRRNEQYGEVEQYSQDPRDLGTMGLDDYAHSMGHIFRRMLPLLRPRAHCLINVADMWWKNTRMPLHMRVIEEMEQAGYELRNTIIWDRTNIVNRVGIFGWPSNYITMGVTYEYLLDFWRPDEQRMEEYERTFGERAIWDSRS